MSTTETIICDMFCADMVIVVVRHYANTCMHTMSKIATGSVNDLIVVVMIDCDND